MVREHAVGRHGGASLAQLIELAKLLSGRELIAIAGLGVLGSIAVVTSSWQVHMCLSLSTPVVVLAMVLRR